jgi:hypothetical protein
MMARQRQDGTQLPVSAVAVVQDGGDDDGSMNPGVQVPKTTKPHWRSQYDAASDKLPVHHLDMQHLNG